jgi:hypothetical protein
LSDSITRANFIGFFFQNNEELSLQVENLRRSVQELKEAIEEKDAEMAGCMATMGQVITRTPD